MRNYDWNGHKNIPISGAKISDEQVARNARLIGLDQLKHEPASTMARDRIMCLVKEKEDFKSELEAVLRCFELGVAIKPTSSVHISIKELLEKVSEEV